MRFPDEETGLAVLDDFAAARGLAVHDNFGPGHESAVATAYPFGGDAFMDALAVLRQEPLTPARLRVTPLNAAELARVPSADAELRLADLVTLFGVPRQLHWAQTRRRGHRRASPTKVSMEGNGNTRR